MLLFYSLYYILLLSQCFYQLYKCLYLHCMHPIMLSCPTTMLVISALLLPYVSSSDYDDTLMGKAIAQTFALSSGAAGVQYNAKCQQRIKGLMQRTSIPYNITSLRWNTTDEELLHIAILASIAHISPWQRVVKNPALILLDDSGKLLPLYSISSMESNIMLCVICTLLAVIASIHILSIRPAVGDSIS